MSERFGHDRTVPDYSAMEEYLGRVQGLRITVGDFLPAEALTDADSLIDHGEPAEGVCYLAWALHKAHVEVPAWVNEAIQDLTQGMVDPAHMPPRLPETPG